MFATHVPSPPALLASPMQEANVAEAGEPSLPSLRRDHPAAPIGRGLADLRSGAVRFSRRVRRRGGGGKPAIETQPGLLDALNELVESSIRVDPEAVLLWVSKSQRHVSAALPSGASPPAR